MDLIARIPALAGAVATPLLFWSAVCLFGLVVERIAPAEARQPAAHLRLNLGFGAVNSIIVTLLNPLVGAAGVGIVNACGGGLIDLPDRGWALVGSAAVFIFAMDFMEYAFHRAQHAVPFLWAMHSLHHSDPSVNVTTTTRAFWLEPGIKAVFVYPMVGILFHVTPAILAIYGVSQLYHFVNHLNLKVHFGRWWVFLNGPQYHRIHHSVEPRHFNRNFAAFFPVFDLIFGTYHRPMPGEFPATGLGADTAPRHLLEAVIWPVRRARAGDRAA
jgi:sterol desaturase/sphingolipid hydroxylase (fatty acid hydroxylase superfamily)